MNPERRTNDIEIRERLTIIESDSKATKEIVTRFDEKLFGNGQPGLVETVTRHKTYWKLFGRILVILGTASAGALAAYAIL